MLSRIALLRAVAVIAVLTVGGVAAAKMGRHNSAVTGDAQLAGVTAQADAAAESGDVAIRGHAMFPLGVPKGLASRSEERSESHPAAVGHLADLDQLRTAAGSGAAFWGSSGQSHNNGGSSAFGAHGSGGGASAFGGVGFGGGQAKSTDKKNADAPKSAAAVKTTPTPKSPAAPPAPPRAPSSAAPVVPARADSSGTGSRPRPRRHCADVGSACYGRDRCAPDLFKSDNADSRDCRRQPQNGPRAASGRSGRGQCPAQGSEPLVDP